MALTSTDASLDGAGDDDDDVDDDAGGDGGDEVPQFSIYKLPIVRLSGCYWYNII